jgi:hypothetical protein
MNEQIVHILDIFREETHVVSPSLWLSDKIPAGLPHNGLSRQPFPAKEQIKPERGGARAMR